MTIPPPMPSVKSSQTGNGGGKSCCTKGKHDELDSVFGWSICGSNCSPTTPLLTAFVFAILNDVMWDKVRNNETSRQEYCSTRQQSSINGRIRQTNDGCSQSGITTTNIAVLAFIPSGKRWHANGGCFLCLSKLLSTFHTWHIESLKRIIEQWWRAHRNPDSIVKKRNERMKNKKGAESKVAWSRQQHNKDGQEQWLLIRWQPATMKAAKVDAL